MGIVFPELTTILYLLPHAYQHRPWLFLCFRCSFTRAWWLWLPLDRFPVQSPMCRSSEKEWTQLRTSLWVLIGWLPTGCLAISVSCAVHCLLTSVSRELLKENFFCKFCNSACSGKPICCGVSECNAAMLFTLGNDWHIADTGDWETYHRGHWGLLIDDVSISTCLWLARCGNVLFLHCTMFTE